MLTLALRLGMTLQDLRERMSAEELLLWMAYHRESPISDMRGDVQASIVAAAAFQAQGVKVTALDMLPKWQPASVSPENEVDAAVEGETSLKAYLLAQAGRPAKCATVAVDEE